MMEVHVLRDRLGKKVGEIQINDRAWKLVDVHGLSLGTYDPKRNVTVDMKGRLLGIGNWLSALLACRISNEENSR